jgi:phosphatidylserine/phosphatidylglycerophosphate/cardiolipin synthase-like enzyme
MKTIATTPRKLLGLTLLSLLFCGCQGNGPTNPNAIAALKTLPALPQDPTIQAYFNHSEAADYQESDRPLKRSGDDLEKILITAIATAKTDIKIAVQEFRLPRIAKALADRAQAGVTIQVVLENKYSTPYSQLTPDQIETLDKRERQRYEDNKALIDGNRDGTLTPEEIQTRDALVILDQAKISRRDDAPNGSRGSGLMHHKFMVIDGKTTIVTSANWTSSDIHGDIKNLSSRGNANSLVKINSAEVTQAFGQEFDLMFRDRKFKTRKPSRSIQSFTVGSSQLKVHFSPSKPRDWSNSGNSLIASTADQAKSSLDLALFVFSDPQLSNRLSALPQRNVTVRGLFEPGFFTRNYSNSLDMLGLPADSPCRKKSSRTSEPAPESSSDLASKPKTQSKRKSSRKPKTTPLVTPPEKGIAQPWPTPAALVAVPKLKPGDLLHHKFAIIDRITVILGSHNWTKAGNHKNDETLMVIENPTIAAHYQREFDRLSKDAIPGQSCQPQAPDLSQDENPS